MRGFCFLALRQKNSQVNLHFVPVGSIFRRVLNHLHGSYIEFESVSVKHTARFFGHTPFYERIVGHFEKTPIVVV